MVGWSVQWCLFVFILALKWAAKQHTRMLVSSELESPPRPYGSEIREEWRLMIASGGSQSGGVSRGSFANYPWIASPYTTATVALLCA